MDKVYIAPVQSACNCNCTFCISKIRNYNKAQTIMKIDDEFYRRLNILKELSIKKVEITGGGEPTLNNDLQSIINYVREYLNDSYIKLYTNGRLQLPIHVVDEINISLASIDDSVNQQIMRYKDTKKIMEIIRYYSEYTDKLRLSIPIIKNAIDSNNNLEKLISQTNQYVSEYVVRTLYDGTLNMDSIYADFDSDNPKVKMEKDNCLCDFTDKLIMWSDNRLYTNWDLNEEYSRVKKVH